jgi:hypothetical protein
MGLERRTVASFQDHVGVESSDPYGSPAAAVLSSPIPPARDQLCDQPDAAADELPGLLARLAEVPDPRKPRRVSHSLEYMLALAACAVLSSGLKVRHQTPSTSSGRAPTRFSRPRGGAERARDDYPGGSDAVITPAMARSSHLDHAPGRSPRRDISRSPGRLRVRASRLWLPKLRWEHCCTSAAGGRLSQSLKG